MNLDSQELLSRLQAEPAPLSFAKLKKAYVTKKSAVTEADLRAALLAPGIFAWPRNSYWHIDPAAQLENEIFNQCRAKAAAAADFKGAKKKEAVLRLIAAKQLLQYPAVEGKKFVIVASAAAHDAYWQYVRETIQAKLKKAGIVEEPDAPLDDKILEILPKLEPELNVPISTVKVRKALGLAENDKKRFDEAALRLLDQRKIYLSQHDHPLALSAEERDWLIDGKDGRYYVAISRPQ